MALPPKERLTSEYVEKKAPVVEVGFSPEIESSKYIKEINKEVSLKEPILDGAGQKIMDNANPKVKVVVLPLTEEEMNKALRLKLKINNSLLWLKTWIGRVVKKVSGSIEYHYKMGPREQGA